MKTTDIIKQCGEVAGMLWQRGWAERNGGNLVVLLPSDIEHDILALPPLTHPIETQVEVPHLANRFLYCKGGGCRMRDLADTPMEYGSIIRIMPDGQHYVIVACKPIVPTSELPSHLLIHNKMVASGSNNTATLHTHPLSLIALSHNPRLLQGPDALPNGLTQILWDMLPEARLFVPKGIGIVPYLEPGSLELAQSTLDGLQNHDIVLWAKHGVLSVGSDIIEAFDTIDIMEKSADIYLRSRIAML